MMISLKVIDEIVQNLDAGMDSYYNSETNEVITVPGRQLIVEDEFLEDFKDSFDKVKKNKKKLVCIEVLESFQSFEIMEDFAAQISNKRFQRQVFQALGKRKPFQHFKHLVEYSDYRQEWFDFKQQALENHVRKHLEILSN